MTLRVASYNVRSLRDDAAAVSEVLATLELDVALIQEAPRFLHSKTKLARMAHDADLYYVCGGRSAAAIAILCSMAVTVVETHEVKLPKTRGYHQRGLAGAILNVRGVDLAFASIHLGLSREERARNVDAILPALRRFGDVPLIIGGDLNELAGDPSWNRVADGRQDTWLVAEQSLGEDTYSSIAPVRRIDAIFCPPAFRVLTAGVPEDLDAALLVRATDHRPVIAHLCVNR